MYNMCLEKSLNLEPKVIFVCTFLPNSFLCIVSFPEAQRREGNLTPLRLQGSLSKQTLIVPGFLLPLGWLFTQKPQGFPEKVPQILGLRLLPWIQHCVHWANLPILRETLKYRAAFHSLGKEMTTHSSILAWKSHGQIGLKYKESQSQT